MKITVIGAGAFGTAMAVSAALHPAGHAVTLWARGSDQLEQLRSERCNARYLPGIALPPGVALSGQDPAALAAGAGLVIVATPMSALRDVLGRLQDCRSPVAWLCKGLEAAAPYVSLHAGQPRDVGRVLEYLRAEQKMHRKVVLVGFGDPKSDATRAAILSKWRAQVVRRELSKADVLIEQLLGFGGEMPVASNEADEGRSKNRRVEVWVY